MTPSPRRSVSAAASSSPSSAKKAKAGTEASSSQLQGKSNGAGERVNSSSGGHEAKEQGDSAPTVEVDSSKKSVPDLKQNEGGDKAVAQHDASDEALAAPAESSAPTNDLEVAAAAAAGAHAPADAAALPVLSEADGQDGTKISEPAKEDGDADMAEPTDGSAAVDTSAVKEAEHSNAAKGEAPRDDMAGDAHTAA